MMRRNKTTAANNETALARTTESLLSWFEDMDWSGPVERWNDGGVAVRKPLVHLIDQGSEFVVRAELPGVPKEKVDLTVIADGIEIRAKTDRSREEKDAELRLQGADVPGPPTLPPLPGRGQGGPGIRDPEGRRP